MDLDAFYCKPTFYVRETRTLVIASVGRRVGGPGSPVWRGGWSLGVGSHDLRGVAPDAVLTALCEAFALSGTAREMGPEARAAWIRTWRSTA